MKSSTLDSSKKDRKRLTPFLALIVAFVALAVGLFTILNVNVEAPPATSTQPAVLPPPSLLTIPCEFGPAHPLLIGPHLQIEGRITSPLHCTDTILSGSVIEVQGLYTGDLAGLSLWILVYTHDSEDNLFYPQAECARKALEVDSQLNRWSTQVHIGRPDRGGLFDIILAATPTDSMKNQSLDTWLNNVCIDKDLEGIRIDELLATEGALVELDTVTVRAE